MKKVLLSKDFEEYFKEDDLVLVKRVELETLETLEHDGIGAHQHPPELGQVVYFAQCIVLHLFHVVPQHQLEYISELLFYFNQLTCHQHVELVELLFLSTTVHHNHSYVLFLTFIQFQLQ